MSDKKEIATLSIKISVDSTDLDKLEAQLNRIAGLMVNAGLKQPAKGGLTMDFGVFSSKGCLEPVFTVSSGVTFINEAYIEHATLEKAMIQAAEKGAREGVEQARAEITTDVNDNAEAALKSSAEFSRVCKVISREQSEFEKFKQQVESKFSQLRAPITTTQQTIADSDRAITESLR